MSDRHRPWKKRCGELEPKEGMYADYAAWEEWMNREMDGDCLGESSGCPSDGSAKDCYWCAVHRWWQDLEPKHRTALYGMTWNLLRAMD